MLLENKEDHDGAEQHYRRAIAIDPEYAGAHYNLGVLLDHKEDYDAPGGDHLHACLWPCAAQPNSLLLVASLLCGHERGFRKAFTQ